MKINIRVYEGSKVVETDADDSAVPRVGDTVSFPEVDARVVSVHWDYTTSDTRVTVLAQA